jgi:hypothetical protein
MLMAAGEHPPQADGLLDVTLERPVGLGGGGVGADRSGLPRPTDVPDQLESLTSLPTAISRMALTQGSGLLSRRPFWARVKVDRRFKDRCSIDAHKFRVEDGAGFNERWSAYSHWALEPIGAVSSRLHCGLRRRLSRSLLTPRRISARCPRLRARLPR